MRFAVHGSVVEVENAVPGLAEAIQSLLGEFAVADWPEGFLPVHGTLRPYDEAEVLRHLSPTARPMAPTDGLASVFEEDERFWVVDERWGMAEINFLKGQWRSWVLPRPQFDPLRCAEKAVLWPLAQLLRPRGLHLLPASAAVSRDGWAFLLICPFGVGPELGALARAGYRLIGGGWAAAREEDGRVSLLHMPVTTAGASGGAWQHHAFCDAVVIADAVRRPRATLGELETTTAAAKLRSAWPIAELHPSRRHSPLPAKLAQLCRCAEVQLSRDGADLLPLLHSLRHRTYAAAA